MKFRNIPFLLALLIASTLEQRGQTNVNIQPDCFIAFTFPAGSASFPATVVNNGPGDNRQKGCSAWTMKYQSTGYTVVSVQVDSGPDTGTTPTFGAFAGTVKSGFANPVVSNTGGETQLTNGTATISWVRVTATVTGAGALTGVLYGWRDSSASISNPGTSGCPGTVATPCVVDGVTAAGSAPTTSPLLVAGQDGAPGNIRTLQTDTTGRQIQVGAAAAGAAVAGNPVLQGWSDGTNAQNAFFCTLRTVITISAGTDAVIAPGAAVKKTIVCHIDFVGNSAQTFTIQEGTGVTCGTGTATVAGPYSATITFAADYGASGALRTATNADDLCLHSGGAVTVGGVVTYAQF